MAYGLSTVLHVAIVLGFGVWLGYTLFARPVEAGARNVRVTLAQPPPEPAPEPPAERLEITLPPERDAPPPTVETELPELDEEPALAPRPAWTPPRTDLGRSIPQPRPAVPTDPPDSVDTVATEASTPSKGTPSEAAPTTPPADPSPSGPPATPARVADATCPLPSYPRLAQREGWGGTVVVALTVRIDGTVEEVRVTTSSGHAVLDNEVVRTLEGWQLEPATKDGAPVVGELTKRFRFDPSGVVSG